MPIRMDDIKEVRPAPHLPPEVEEHWQRAQHILFLLRRCVALSIDTATYI